MKDVPPLSPPGDLAVAYDRYFRSGLYDTRYPAPNRWLLRLVLRCIGDRPARLLDFGCGTGRYALPVLAASQAAVIGHDTSEEALRTLRQRGAAAIAAGRLLTVDGPFEALTGLLQRTGPVDVALLAFGCSPTSPAGGSGWRCCAGWPAGWRRGGG